MHQDVIGHHVFTNAPRGDPDVRAPPRRLRQSPGSAWYQGAQSAEAGGSHDGALFADHAAAEPVSDHLLHHAGWVNGAVPLVIATRRRRLLHVAGPLLVAASLFVWPFFLFPFWKALAFATIPSLVLSELFALFSRSTT
jgi:hypothetical protein